MKLHIEKQNENSDLITKSFTNGLKSGNSSIDRLAKYIKEKVGHVYKTGRGGSHIWISDGNERIAIIYF